MNHRPAPPLPFTPPAWLTPSRIAAAAVVAFAMTAAVPSVWWALRPARDAIADSLGGALFLTGLTALLSLLLALWTLRADATDVPNVRSVGGGMGAGALNGILCVVAVKLFLHHDPDSIEVGMLAGSIAGCVFGGMLGLLYGVAYAFVLAPASRARRSPSHDGPDRVLLTSGVWLALSGAALLCLEGSAPALIPPAALVVVGVPLAGAALVRLTLRKRWVENVTRGLVPAFRIDKPTLNAAGSVEGLLPVLRPRSNLSSILMYFGHSPGGPYRAPSSGTPVALIDLSLARGRDAGPAPSPEGSKALAVSLPTAAQELWRVGSAILTAFAKIVGLLLVILLALVVFAAPFFSVAFGGEWR